MKIQSLFLEHYLCKKKDAWGYSQAPWFLDQVEFFF